MSNRSLADEIITLIQNESNNNPAPKNCKIINNYGDKPYCDVEVEDLGKLTYIKTIGSTDIGLDGIICFLNGDLNQGIVISSTKSSENDGLNDDLTGLLEVIDNYYQFSDKKYTLFRNDLWTVNFNYEAIACIVCDGDDDLTVTGTFRTIHDMVGLYWYSKDLITHPYISYGERCDYTDVVLEFDYEMNGCVDFSENIISITFVSNNGESYYVSMPQFIENNHFRLDFNNLKQRVGDAYRDKDGNLLFRSEEFKIPVEDLKYILFVFVSENYDENQTDYIISENIDFECKITNIEVTNGYISNEHLPLNPHNYRLCEGYDDFYNFNPLRIANEMRKLGYTEWVDLYIGASHYYEKSGTIGDIVDTTDFNHIRTEKMVLDSTKPLNIAFRTWLEHYASALKNNDVNNLIISVSMENLQCPKSWRQKHNDGMDAQTGWIPSTFFYSPCNDEVIDYMQRVSQECLDIVVSNGMAPILQMGEAWWWWQEGYPESVGESEITWEIFPNQPPCFYDDATKEKYRLHFGKEIPIYTTSWCEYDHATINWLNQQLVNYTDKLREVVKSNRYSNGLYMALFFPPFVSDVDRVPPMMREVNYIKNTYSPLKLDILQLEDYDWVTGESIHHDEVYSIGQKLGFKTDKLHYFGGYVQYHKNAIKEWGLIKKAMKKALKEGFSEVYAWSGSQVRRDNQFIGYEVYELLLYILDNLKGDDSEIWDAINQKSDKNHAHSEYLTSHQSLSDYLTESEINALLSSYALSSSLNNYYTKNDANNIFALKNHSHSQYLTSHQSLSDYLTESKINTLLSSYVLSSSLNNYYTKSESNNTFAQKNHSHSQYLTSHQSLSDYLTESEINALLSSYALSSSLNNYYTKSEANNSFATKNHSHHDTDINWNGSALAGSVSPLDMAMYEEFNANRLAYLPGGNIIVEYSTDGGSTWNDYGATGLDKLELVTTSHGFVAGKAATANSKNQLRITINAGGGNNVQSNVYLATRKLMIYYGTGGGSNTKVKIETSAYGTPTNWNVLGTYNIAGWTGWNSYPLNITFGGYANQTTGSRIQNIRLTFTTGSAHNFSVHKIRLFGENCWLKPSTLAETGHMYTFDNDKNVTFPAKIIKNGGTNNQFLKADGSLDNNSYALSNHIHDELNDSGWIDVHNADLNGNFFNYHTQDLVHYRKIGNTVYLAGTVMANGNLSVGEWQIMNLPEGFRPSREVTALCELVNTTSLWTCTIKTNGDVCFNNLRDGDVKRTAIQWTDVLRFDVSFVI